MLHIEYKWGLSDPPAILEVTRVKVGAFKYKATWTTGFWSSTETSGQFFRSLHEMFRALREEIERQEGK